MEYDNKRYLFANCYNHMNCEHSQKGYYTHFIHKNTCPIGKEFSSEVEWISNRNFASES